MGKILLIFFATFLIARVSSTLDPDQLKECIKKDSNLQYDNPEDVNRSCLLFCTLQSSGVMKEDGTFDLEVIERTVSAAILPKIIRCTKVAASNPCQRATRYFLCNTMETVHFVWTST